MTELSPLVCFSKYRSVVSEGSRIFGAPRFRGGSGARVPARGFVVFLAHVSPRCSHRPDRPLQLRDAQVDAFCEPIVTRKPETGRKSAQTSTDKRIAIAWQFASLSGSQPVCRLERSRYVADLHQHHRCRDTVGISERPGVRCYAACVLSCSRDPDPVTTLDRL